MTETSAQSLDDGEEENSLPPSLLALPLKSPINMKTLPAGYKKLFSAFFDFEKLLFDRTSSLDFAAYSRRAFFWRLFRFEVESLGTFVFFF